MSESDYVSRLLRRLKEESGKSENSFTRPLSVVITSEEGWEAIKKRIANQSEIVEDHATMSSVFGIEVIVCSNEKEASKCRRIYRAQGYDTLLLGYQVELKKCKI